MLEDQRGLQIPGAVEARRQPEVSFKETTNPSETFKDVVGYGGTHREGGIDN